ncbi:MAG: excinuclease ABC subunit UvrC [Myxococcales bacterium]|nr:excinuclease ABC subunit UvrC [Myxococcales bacterium]
MPSRPRSKRAAADLPAPAAQPPPAPATAEEEAAGADPVPPALKELLERLPAEPGVYLMKDKKGRVLYVGKAQNLRARVRSYFARGSDGRAFVRLLDRLVADIETIVTGNEKEALLLENNLIKQHRPRFNVKLVDDKNYLVLRLDMRADYPRLEVTRRIRDDGARYFGPYHSATACRQTLEVVNRHFKLRTCTDQVMRSRRRPCLQYQIKRCDAPCVFPVSKAEYAEQVRDVALFLDGKDQELTQRLRERMLSASAEMKFEVAAALRDQLRALERTLEEQRVVSAQFVDQDVFGYYREGDVLTIAILHIRQGKLLGTRSYHFTDQEFPDEESLSAFVGLYYDMGNIIPDEVILPMAIEDQQAKQEWLRDKVAAGGRKRASVQVLSPRRGPRARLVELACRNAAAAFRTRGDQRRNIQDALVKLERRLHLRRLPRRIECFDVSHLQGSFPVAAMVVFVDGEPLRSAYRTFKVRSVQNDDCAALYEVLLRRFRRARAALDAAGTQTAAGQQDHAVRPTEQTGTGEDRDQGDSQAATWALPDLVVIDGGKGQLGSAMAALRDAGLEPHQVDLVALAKEREVGEGAAARHEPDRVFLPKVKDPLRLRPNTTELFILSRIRDEAHRFAVATHGRQRQRAALRSRLQDIPGVGPKRQRALLRALGSVRRIREASLEELLAVPGLGRQAAEAVRAFFDQEAALTTASEAADPPGSAGRPPSPQAPVVDDSAVAENAAEQELLQMAEEVELVSEEMQRLVAEASLRGSEEASQ